MGVGGQRLGIGQFPLQVRAHGLGVFQQGVELGNLLILAFQPGVEGGDLLLQFALGGGQILNLGGQLCVLAFGGIFAREANDGQHHGDEQRKAHNIKRGLVAGSGGRGFGLSHVGDLLFIFRLPYYSTGMSEREDFFPEHSFQPLARHGRRMTKKGKNPNGTGKQKTC